jgi:hypothetical protein
MKKRDRIMITVMNAGWSVSSGRTRISANLLIERKQSHSAYHK